MRAARAKQPAATPAETIGHINACVATMRACARELTAIEFLEYNRPRRVRGETKKASSADMVATRRMTAALRAMQALEIVLSEDLDSYTSQTAGVALVTLANAITTAATDATRVAQAARKGR